MVSVCVIWFLFGLLQECLLEGMHYLQPQAMQMYITNGQPDDFRSREHLHFLGLLISDSPLWDLGKLERSSNEPGARAWPKIPWDFLALRHPHNTHGLGTRKKGTRLQHGIVQNSSNPKWLSWYGHTVIYGESSKVGEKHAHWNAPKLGSQLSFAQVLVTIGQDLEVYPMILLGPDSFGRILHICRYLILHWHKPSLTGLTRHCGSPPWDWTSTHLELWDETWQTSGPGREPLEFGDEMFVKKCPWNVHQHVLYTYSCVTKDESQNILNIKWTYEMCTLSLYFPYLDHCFDFQSSYLVTSNGDSWCSWSPQQVSTASQWDQPSWTLQNDSIRKYIKIPVRDHDAKKKKNRHNMNLP